ncbi:hypothetical protein KSS87_002458 [Heliosperma pusillum]|nr:hypothetical protein KSS87_002458 [Heliosperma pusillum]
MWRKTTKFDILRKITTSREVKPASCVKVLKELSQDSTKVRHFSVKSVIAQGYKCPGIGRNGEVLSQKAEMGSYNSMIHRNPFGFSRVCNQLLRHYGSAAAEAIMSTSSEEDEEVRELVVEISKHHRNKGHNLPPRETKMIAGMSQWKYNTLRKRQVKVETEAWNDAAREYQELLADMCEQKLAPNLPYIKSLFLGWFEPLKDAISAEQDLCKIGKNRGDYAPYFDELPADMTAVITMHKLMGLLMMGDGHGVPLLCKHQLKLVKL